MRRKQGLLNVQSISLKEIGENETMTMSLKDYIHVQAMLDFLLDLAQAHPGVKEALEKHNELEETRKISSEMWNNIETMRF